jgi:phage terminase large subunit
MQKKKTIRIPDLAIFNDAYRDFVLDKSSTHKPLIVLEGGRGSAKSREIAHHLILRSLGSKIRVALVRKVFDTIRDSQYTEIRDVVNLWGIASEFEFIASPLTIRAKSGSQFICRGMDKLTKIKSIANVDVVWVEEADELTEADWMALNFSIRGKIEGRPKQKILSFNRHNGNWTEKHFFNADNSFREAADTYHLHTTFQDNKFLDKEFLSEIEKIRLADPELYKKIALGLPVKLKGLVYDNWRTVDEFPANCTEIIYGLDFGYHPDPTVLLKLGRIGMDIYIEELVYDRKLTNTDLIARIKELSIDKSIEMYADSAEPDRIEEIYRAGYNIKPADKGQGSVEFGIDVCKRYKLNIIQRSTATRKDFENYKWKADQNGEPLSPPVPAHPYSHGPDALRYPVSTHWGKEFRRITEDDMRGVDMPEMESVSIVQDY